MPVKKCEKTVFIFALAGSLACILWLTLFSRLGSDSRHFYPPFWSYKAILNGDTDVLWEDAGNVILFIPVGVALTLFFRCGVKQSVLFGLLISLVIESCQWFFRLGTFEFDDLLHNAIGAGTGTVFVNHTGFGKRLSPANRRKSLIALFVLTAAFISVGLGCRELKWREMKKLAACNDREDGSVNLLVLSPEPVYIGETGFSVSYNSDGSIKIAGSADKRAWIEIGRLTLGKGSYSFSGLSGVEEETVAIELEYYDADQQNFVRFTPDVGRIERVEFTLQDSTRLRALIGLYAGAEGTFTARPAIYREDK